MFFLLSLPLFAMPSNDFELLTEQIEEASFNSDKLSIVDLASQHNTFTCDQVAEIIGHLSFDSDQLEALNILAPRIEDPSRTFIILKVFTFQSSRAQAEAILSSKAPKQSLEDKRNLERQEKEKKAEAERKKQEEKKAEAERKRQENRINREEGPKLNWVGRCKPRSTECISFNPKLFSPIFTRKKHHRWPTHPLQLEVTGPGVLDINIKMGKKLSCKRGQVRYKSSKQELTHHITLTEGTQIIDVTRLVTDWKRTDVEIMATKDHMGAYIKLDQWKRCD